MTDLGPLLVFADDWGRHPSSCQHLIRRLREGARVLWVNTIGTRQVKANAFTIRRGLEKVRNWGSGLRQVSESMWVLDVPMIPGLSRPILRKVNRTILTAQLRSVLAHLGMPRPTCITTLPYIGWLIPDLPRRALVYYCTDDYSHWPSADRETLQQADREITIQADLILAASKALYDTHSFTGRAKYFPHGVDIEHFSSTQHANISSVIADLPRPRICFFGLIYEKLNFNLLSCIARRFARGSLVMIGPSDYCPNEFRANRNVHFIGAQPYEKLPSFLAGMDVLLLPYVDDPMIRQSGPLKLRECLASGKPTVSIDIPDVRLMTPHVRVAGTTVDFLEQIDQALNEDPACSAVIDRQRAVGQDDWLHRANQMKSLLVCLDPKNRSPSTCVANSRGRTSKKLHRVLHLRTISGKGGGPEKTLLNSPRFLCDQFDVRLAYLRPTDDAEYDMPERARMMGVRLIDIAERNPYDLSALLQLYREVRAFNPDILHAHDYKTNVLSILLGRCFGIPVVTTLHGYGVRDRKLNRYYRVDRWALPRMDHIISVSEDLFQGVKKLGIPMARNSLIENGIDTDQYSRRTLPTDTLSGVRRTSSKLIVGAVGRLSTEKGFDLLIQASDHLLREGFEFELVIVGDGPEKYHLQSLIKETNQEARIKLLGHRTDMVELYHLFDVFVLSSLREGFPNVLLEAMSMEVPVLATHVAGVPKLVVNDVTGLLVAPGSVEELIRALRCLLIDPQLRNRLARAGRSHVMKHNSFEVRMSKIRKIYEIVLSKRRTKSF